MTELIINGRKCKINNPPLNTKAQMRLVEANEMLWKRWPFFATIIRQLAWAEAEGLKTIGVSSFDMMYDPEFILARPLNELEFILAHEATHVVMKHPLRVDLVKRADVYLIAADYAVNSFLADCGGILPADATYNPKFRNWLTEEIYEELMKNPPPMPQAGKSQADGSGGRIGDPDKQGGVVGDTDANGQPLTGGGAAEAQMEVEDNIRDAMDKAKDAGNTSGDLLRKLELLALPTRDLHDILREYVSETIIPTDYSYSRPNRRYMKAGIVMPGLKKEHVGEIALVIDNSGSIDSYALSLFNVSVKAILEDLNPAMAHLMYCDTRVHRFDSYENGAIPDLDSTGGGGTDFRDPFIQLENKGIQPLVLIYFTDLECHSFAPEPNYPVIWAYWGDSGTTPPYGRVIPIRST